MGHKLTVEEAIARLPNEITAAQFIGPFMLRYAEGSRSETRFFGEDYAQAVAEELGTDWVAEREGSESRYPAEAGTIAKRDSRIVFSVKGWGATGYSRVIIRSWVKSGMPGLGSGPDITVASDRPIAEVVKELRRRVFPDLWKIEEKVAAAKAAQDAEEADTAAKYESLKAEYPKLAWLRDRDGKITLSSRFGCNLYLSGVSIYKPTGKDSWRLYSQTFQIEDVDAPSGKAFLSLLNGQ